jgi:hypothetical protein
MPVILDPADYDVWLDPDVRDTKQLEPLLVPYTSEGDGGAPGQYACEQSEGG